MPFRTDLDYLYDGSFDGLLCCVFESFYHKELPSFISLPDTLQASLFPQKSIPSSHSNAKKVADALAAKVSPLALNLVRDAFLSCLPDKELHILRYCHLAFKAGPPILNMLTNPTVLTLNNAVSHLHKEAQLYRGFVRFSDINGTLVSVIEPKNFILPILLPHFCDRFNCESFLIYDKSHSMLLMFCDGIPKLASVDSFSPAPISSEELDFQSLWKSFYDSIAISERFNPRCRLSLMPKRYWSQLTEFLDTKTPSQCLPQNTLHALHIETES